MPKPKSRKKFIDKKNAVTFNLVHRSQRDPLIADENAPQRVLVPVNATVPPNKEKDPDLTPEQRIAEQQKYGIYFDDDYNYLQHLKDSREVTMLLQPKTPHKKTVKKEVKQDGDGSELLETVTNKLLLPSSVFASEVEEDIGLLHRAAPQGLCLEVDPDVVAALDGDFDFDDPDNQLDDDFVIQATAPGNSDDEYSEEEDSMQESDDEYDSDDSGQVNVSDDDSAEEQDTRGGRMPHWDRFAKEETKSRFSQYSMSSSVMRRNQGLTLLDNMFEKMMDTYDDTELGALDTEDIEGHMTERDDALMQAAEEYEMMQAKYKLDKDKELARLQRLQDIAEESSDEDLVTVPVEEKEKWDCETIISTYSNIYNHPKLIDEPKRNKIKISTKSGLPVDTLGKDTNKLTVKSLAKFNAMQETKAKDDDDGTQAETVLSTLSVLSIRPKDETPEEKKERKRLLKEYRQERRFEKKANREAFKEEKKRQEKILMNNRNNVQGNRIL